MCQCPFGLLFISTEPEPKPEPMCQCPFGLLFISTRPLLLYSEENRMCQCPFGLLFISTAQRKEAIMMDSSVSMPIRASLHFHNTGAIYRLILDNHVSMPIRAFLHFYLKNGVCFHGGNGCVNALLGFPSFLQHPSGTRRNKAFSRPFLQVFI